MGKAAKPERRSSVRVIAGRLKGRRIPIGSDSIRPTPDRVRETLFNWLGPSLAGASCLDMFAGSGALGIEAASRGAAQVQFVERDRRAAEGLGELLAKLGVPGEVLRADALRLDYARLGPFDIVFLDPPFDGPDLANLCTLLERCGCLTASALIYLEMHRRTQLPELPSGWEISREQTAGQVRFGLIERKLPMNTSGADQ